MIKKGAKISIFQPTLLWLGQMQPQILLRLPHMVQISQDGENEQNVSLFPFLSFTVKGF